MTKQGQDFWTAAFLLVAFIFTVVWAFRVATNGQAAERHRITAVLVLIVYGIAVPVTLFALGAAPDIWRIFTAPFVQ